MQVLKNRKKMGEDEHNHNGSRRQTSYKIEKRYAICLFPEEGNIRLSVEGSILDARISNSKQSVSVESAIRIQPYENFESNIQALGKGNIFISLL